MGGLRLSSRGDGRRRFLKLALAAASTTIVSCAQRGQQNLPARRPAVTPALPWPAAPPDPTLAPVSPADRPTATSENPTATIPAVNSPATTRAVSSYEAIEREMYRPNAMPGETLPLYLEQTPRLGAYPYAYEWPLSQLIAATLDLLALPAVAHNTYSAALSRQLHETLPLYWDGTAYRSYVVQPLGHNGDRFYDDNAWAALNLTRAYLRQPDEALVERAARVFEYLISGWDDNPAHAAPGGIFWVEAEWNLARTVVSNAPSIQVALRLYQITGEAGYLEWGRRIYDWVNDTLLGPGDLYGDSISLEGTVEKTVWSYNQGAMAGASALLYEVTGESAYLTRAVSTAEAALRHFGPAGYTAQQPVYNAIFFRNLLYLATLDSSLLDATMTALAAYAEFLWERYRLPDGLFRFPEFPGTTRLIDQAAVVQLFALQAMDPGDYRGLV